jgi:hypothetical protein
MTYKLVHKGSDEAIDKVTISSDVVKKYFMMSKQLSEEHFDNLFEVKEVKSRKTPVNYNWWEEEKANLDIEKS